MCSVIVWTFTSSRFCGKLCCCNLFVPKSFSLVGILLITWVFFTQTVDSGGKSFKKLWIESWRVRETLPSVSRAFFFKTRPSPFPWHSISRLEQMKYQLLVMFIISRVRSWTAAFYQLCLNETKQKRYCIIHIFLIVAHTNETTNITIAVTRTIRFPQCNAFVYVCICVCVCVCVCVRVCSFVCLCVKYT